MMNKLTIKQRTILATIIAVIIGGGVTPLTKIAVQTIPVFTFTFLRFFFASLVVLPYFLKHMPRLNKRLYKLILFSLFLSANVIVYPFGVRLTTATIAQTLYVFVPIITAVISYFFLAEVFTIRKITGILVSLCGALIIILLPQITRNSPFAGNLTGNLIICIGVITVAIYTVFSKNFQKNYTPFQINAVFIFTTCILSFFLAINELSGSHSWMNHVTMISLVSTAYVGIIGSALWYLLYQYIIHHSSPLIASMILYMQPAATFVWAAFLLGEQLTPGFLIGAALAFIGVFFTMQTSISRKN